MTDTVQLHSDRVKGRVHMTIASMGMQDCYAIMFDSKKTASKYVNQNYCELGAKEWLPVDRRTLDDIVDCTEANNVRLLHYDGIIEPHMTVDAPVREAA